MTACYVYEVYDADKRLIYIGASINVVQRMQTHSTDAWWGAQIAKVKASVYCDVPTARTEESRRIREMHPRWNIHRQAPRATWTATHYEDYVTNAAARAEFDDSYTKLARHFRLCAREYKARFGADLILPERLKKKAA